MNKIDEALDILKSLGLPDKYLNQVSALTLLALAGIGPDDLWSDASNNALTIARGIMDFVKDRYNIQYKENSRETFRKKAIIPFLEKKIIIKNPYEENEQIHSSKTNYALSPNVLSVIIKYNSPVWKVTLNAHIESIKEYEVKKDIILTKIEIRNYKSILEDAIDLGRINIFIGANGCGKTNILEAIAVVGASYSDDLTLEGLFNRGVRVAKPTLTYSSFLDKPQMENFEIILSFGKEQMENSFTALQRDDIFSKWFNDKQSLNVEQFISEFANLIKTEVEKGSDIDALIPKIKLSDFTSFQLKAKNKDYKDVLSSYLIYDLNTIALRGLSSQSKKTPLGIYGESLDLLLSILDPVETRLLKQKMYIFKWLESYMIDKDEKTKLEGHKLGKSISNLYFKDKFMQKFNNIFSAENANEGILHVLFYLALFVSKLTPSLFAIDNIETALNPKLCRTLIKELIELAKSTHKQALITTHNPAILDGLNLLDDEQRLFEVYRTENGYTKTRRIMFKKENLGQKTMKLSEMWMNGLIGGIPNDF